jgi:hypothetical protein
VLAVAGSAIVSILATLFGDAGYGSKEATLQVVLAAAGVGVVARSACGGRPGGVGPHQDREG